MRWLILACCVLAVSFALFLYQEHRAAQHMAALTEMELAEEQQINDSAALTLTNAWFRAHEIQPREEPVDAVEALESAGWHTDAAEEECCPEEDVASTFGVDDTIEAEQDEPEPENPARTVANLRKYLIREYGDIPLVDRYLAARAKFFRKEHLTNEEFLTFLEGLATFVPTEHNKRTYEAFKNQGLPPDGAEDTMTYNQ